MTCNSCLCAFVAAHTHIPMQTQNQRNKQKPNPAPKILFRALCSVTVRPFVPVDRIQQADAISFFLVGSLNRAWKYDLSAFTAL